MNNILAKLVLVAGLQNMLSYEAGNRVLSHFDRDALADHLEGSVDVLEGKTDDEQEEAVLNMLKEVFPEYVRLSDES